MASHEILGVCTGNSRTRIARVDADGVHDPLSIENDARDAIIDAIGERRGDLPVVTSTVVPDLTEAIRALDLYEVGRDLPITINHTLDDASTVGQDRWVNAIGAYRKTGQATVIIDVGTAVTVDFVDGEGTFHGGVIAPGVTMMLRALHDRTAQLPEVEASTPVTTDTPFGKSTADAMVKGARASVIGLAHHMIESSAIFFGAYPQILATGGDATLLFGEDELIEHLVPDLQMLGLFEVSRQARE